MDISDLARPDVAPNEVSTSGAAVASRLHAGIVEGCSAPEVQGREVPAWRGEVKNELLPPVVHSRGNEEEPPRRYYAVARGRRPGIYTSWDEIEPLVSGFRGNKHKSFRTKQEAEAHIVQERVKFH